MVNNLPERRLCWQCGSELPMSTGPDGRSRAVSDAELHQRRKAEIEALLAQAQTIDLQAKPKSAVPQAAESRKPWLQRVLKGEPTPQEPIQTPTLARKSGLLSRKRRQSES
jgi:hypothetical protein